MDKKLEVKRLCIYLALSFGLAWILFFVYSMTGHKWDGEITALESAVGLGMLAPLIAHALTRWITQEGFAMTGKDSMMLGISFKDKKWIYYLFAILIPWVYFEIGHLISICIRPQLFAWDNYKQTELGLAVVMISPIIGIIGGVVSSFAALGEEGGWRAYMMPKLIKLFGLKKAVVIGGVIWGIWHAPLTCVGHNFGTDYVGFPYLGIVLMCVYCTLVGIMLTYITLKTESVWPAAFMHAVNNQNPSILKCFMDKNMEAGRNSVFIFWISLMIPLLLLSIYCFVKMLKTEKE